MVANERQYWITLEWAERFEDAVAELNPNESNLHPRIFQALVAGYKSQAQELREQLAEYEAKHGIPSTSRGASH